MIVLAVIGIILNIIISLWLEHWDVEEYLNSPLLYFDIIGGIILLIVASIVD